MLSTIQLKEAEKHCFRMDKIKFHTHTQ